MIATIVLIVLVVLLVGLLTDWNSLLRRFRKSEQPTWDVPRIADELQPVVDPTPEQDHEMHPEPLLVVPYRPNEEVSGLLEDADIHFRRGEMDEAEKLYIQAAAKDPKAATAYSRLGVIYLEHGENWEDAEAAFRQALKYETNNGFNLNNLGLVLYHQDRYADAIRQFEAAVRQDDHNAGRQANLGMAYMAMRQYAKAESAFKKALKLAPQEAEYKDLLTEALEKKQAHKSMVRR